MAGGVAPLYFHWPGTGVSFDWNLSAWGLSIDDPTGDVAAEVLLKTCS